MQAGWRECGGTRVNVDRWAIKQLGYRLGSHAGMHGDQETN